MPAGGCRTSTTISKASRRTLGDQSQASRFPFTGREVRMRSRFIDSFAIAALLAAGARAAEPSHTEITRWQDGKEACVSLTFDDSSINQFRIDIPLLNERGIPGTFFVITGGIQGSKNQPAFAGRPKIGSA